MPNMTMTIDAKVLKKARKIAVEKNTTVSRIVSSLEKRIGNVKISMSDKNFSQETKLQGRRRMKEQNTSSLDNLSRTAYRSGVFSVFLGVLVAFVHVINGDFTQILVGLLIFIMGYGLVKVASKIRFVINDEKV